MRRIVLYAFTLLMLASCGGHKQTVRQPAADGTYSAAADRHAGSPYSGRLVKEAEKWIGTRYLFAGETRKGTDCSGMVMSIYRDITGIKLPRSSREQQAFCHQVGVAELAPGDLVFFSGKAGDKVSHVGIYVGDGQFIHASASKGVIRSSLNQSYYTRHFHSAGRVPGVVAARDKNEKKGRKDNATGASVPADENTAGFTLTPVDRLPGEAAAASATATAPETVRIVEVIRDTVYIQAEAGPAAKDSISSEVRRAMQF